MRRRMGLLAVAGLFGLVAGADAQTPPGGTGRAFDGSYRLVSSSRVNEMYTTKKGQMAQCPERAPGTLKIVRGRARYTTATGYRLRGNVGPQGELAMRSSAPGISRPIDINLNGRIDGTGVVHARQISNACNYDFVWQRS